MKGKLYKTNRPDIRHIHVTEKTIKKEFQSLLKKHAFPPDSEYTDYYGARNIIHGMLVFFGTKRIVDFAKKYTFNSCVVLIRVIVASFLGILMPK